MVEFGQALEVTGVDCSKILGYRHKGKAPILNKIVKKAVTDTFSLSRTKFS